MLSICIYSPVFYPSVGGLQLITLILARELGIAGNKVEVVTETHGLSDADDLRFPFKVTRTTNFLSRVKLFERADVVLFMNLSLHGIASALAARNTKVVLSHHGIYRGTGVLRRFLEFVKRQMTRLFPNISVSQFVAKSIPGRSVIINNAYDDALFQQPENVSRASDFVFCGRLVSDKGADVCLRAFASVAEVYSDANLTVVGDGPERAKLLRLAYELGVADRVIFKGFLTGAVLVSELQKHRCMLVPSLWEEPFGIVALEGIACCQTVIVSRRGGLPEAIGPCGVIVEPTETGFSAAMCEVVKKARAGEVLPGEPQVEVRKLHLEQHTARSVAKKYLDVVTAPVFGASA